MKFDLFDKVSVTETLPERNLLKGMIGVIISVYRENRTFEIEIRSKEGKIYTIATVDSNEIAKVTNDRIINLEFVKND